MTYYFNAGTHIDVVPSTSVDVSQKLPPAVYMMKKNPMSGEFQLIPTSTFEIPSKIYGNTVERVDRIVSTFHDREKSTGILLAGEKGAGKTLLTKLVSNRLLSQGISTIIVNEELYGEAFNRVISNIDESALIIFDEFDKVYEEQNQTALLTLLDGVINTKKLFMFTMNSGKVSEFFMNRPGRIFYKFDYSGLEVDFVKEYCADTLKNKSHLVEIEMMVDMFSMFSFDMLQALVEEVNRYDESPYKAVQCLNVDITKEFCEYEIELIYDGQPVTNSFYPLSTTKNPMSGTSFEVAVYERKGRTFEDGAPELTISRQTLKKCTAGGMMTHEFEYEGKELLVIMRKKEPFKFHWDAL